MACHPITAFRKANNCAWTVVGQPGPGQPGHPKSVRDGSGGGENEQSLGISTEYPTYVRNTTIPRRHNKSPFPDWMSH